MSGVADDDAVARCNEEFASDTRFRSGLLMLVDPSELATRPVTEAQVEATAERVVQRDWDYPVAAIAYVVVGEQAAHELKQWRARFGGSRSRRRRLFARKTTRLGTRPSLAPRSQPGPRIIAGREDLPPTCAATHAPFALLNGLENAQSQACAHGSANRSGSRVGRGESKRPPRTDHFSVNLQARGS